MNEFNNLIDAEYEKIILNHNRNISKNKKKILFATSIASFEHGRALDNLLATSLFMRGHDVEFMYCDSAIPVCQVIKIQNFKPSILVGKDDTPRCNKCIQRIPTKNELKFSKVNTFGEIIKELDYRPKYKIDFEKLSLREILIAEIDTMPIGTHIRAGLVRYFATPHFESEEHALEMAKKYGKSSLTTLNIYDYYIQKYEPDVIVAHHGIYVPQGIIALIAKMKQVKLVIWNPSYRKGTFIFSHDESYHYSMIKEPNSRWENMEINNTDSNQLEVYMSSREKGINDWIKFNDTMPRKQWVDTLLKFKNKSINKNQQKKFTFGLLTNVTWDADLHFDNKVYDSMTEWLIQTIKFFNENPNLELIIRVHPAEETGNVKSRHRVKQILEETFVNMPQNVTLIDSVNKANTYDVMRNCDAIIIYGTKAGIEFAYRGKLVIICGESWLRGKNIGIDISDESEYFAKLKEVSMLKLKQIDKHRLERAKKYAFHFFFRRMMFLPWFEIESENSNKWRINIQKIEELALGNNSNLDTICDGIVSQKQFEAPEVGIV